MLLAVLGLLTLYAVKRGDLVAGGSRNTRLPGPASEVYAGRQDTWVLRELTEGAGPRLGA
jgi:hypothetical protein